MRQGCVHIGIDLDNTLIDYHALFCEAAAVEGLNLPSATEKNRVRDVVRASRGDVCWQRIQARVYGNWIHRARLFPDALATLTRWHREGCTLSVVSHKTMFAAQGGDTDLRQCALAFFMSTPLAQIIPPSRLWFTDTRKEKCQTIAALGCHFFIDDLQEVLSDAAFPPETVPILFTNWRSAAQQVDAARESA